MQCRLLDVELESTCLSCYVRVVALDLYCLGSAQPVCCFGSSMVEHLPSKRNVIGSSPTQEALFSFSMERKMIMLVVLPRFNICRAISFQLGVGRNCRAENQSGMTHKS